MASLVRGLASLRPLLTYAELGVEVKVGKGETSRSRRSVSRSRSRSEWLLLRRRSSLCVFCVKLGRRKDGEARGRGWEGERLIAEARVASGDRERDLERSEKSWTAVLALEELEW